MIYCLFICIIRRFVSLFSSGFILVAKKIKLNLKIEIIFFSKWRNNRVLALRNLIKHRIYEIIGIY